MADPATRERLLDAAWRLVTERGIDDLTLAVVGAEAGVSRQAVYLHFGNRATLLTAMAARVDHTSGFRRRLAAAQTRPPVEAFRALLDAWFGYLPTILPVALALEASWLSGGDGGEAYRDRMGDWRTGIRLAVQRLDDSRQLADGWSVDDATDWVWAMIHPTHYHHLTADRSWTARATRRRLAATLERDLIDRDEGVTDVGDDVRGGSPGLRELSDTVGAPGRIVERGEVAGVGEAGGRGVREGADEVFDDVT